MQFEQRKHVRLFWQHCHLIGIDNNQDFLKHVSVFPLHVNAIPPNLQVPEFVVDDVFESGPELWKQRYA